jgi:hypothetical protein
LKDVGCSWEDGIKIDCREIEWDGWNDSFGSESNPW